MKPAKQKKYPHSLHLSGTQVDRGKQSFEEPCKFLPHRASIALTSFYQRG